MDCVAVYEDGEDSGKGVQEHKGGTTLFFLGRTENCEEGIYVHDDGFRFPGSGRGGKGQAPFPSGRAEAGETAFSYDYDQPVRAP